MIERDWATNEEVVQDMILELDWCLGSPSWASAATFRNLDNTIIVEKNPKCMQEIS